MNPPRLNALIPALRLAFLVAALWLLLACDAEDPTATAVPSPTVPPAPTATLPPTLAPSPTPTPHPTAAPSPMPTSSPTAVPIPTATPAPTATPVHDTGENEFSFDFDSDAEGWTVGFADLPVDYDQSIYELDYDYRPLPDGLEGSGIYVQGHNRSDDLFMFLKRRVDGLMPNKVYAVSVSLDLATNVATGLVGIGGSPGESVYVKAGASTAEPLAMEDEIGHLRMNIDKGNQSKAAKLWRSWEMLAHPEVAGDEYLLKTLDNTDLPLSVTTDGEGRAWLIVGTDSGFEGLTQLYYASISYVLTPMT